LTKSSSNRRSTPTSCEGRSIGTCPYPQRYRNTQGGLWTALFQKNILSNSNTGIHILQSPSRDRTLTNRLRLSSKVQSSATTPAPPG
jgi:hypothetical protein